MAFDPALLELLSQTCTIAPPTTLNGYAEDNGFGTAVTPRCHIRYKQKHTYSQGAVLLVEDGTVILDGVYDVTTEWFLSLPDVGGGPERRVKIVSVDQYADEDGPHHTTLHFGAF